MNLKKVIENDFEEKLYIAKIDEVMNYLKSFGGRTFFDIVRNVGGSEKTRGALDGISANRGSCKFVYIIRI